MKSKTRKNMREKQNGYKKGRKPRHIDKDSASRWNHDKFDNNQIQWPRNSEKSQQNGPSFGFSGRKKKKFYIGKKRRGVKPIVIECSNILLVINDNPNFAETNEKIDAFLSYLGIKQFNKTFFLFKIRIFFEIKEKRFACFEEDYYNQILNEYEQNFLFEKNY